LQTGNYKKIIEMRKVILTGIISFILISMLPAQKEKPYILAGSVTGSVQNLKGEVENKLAANGFEILGWYNPTQSKSRVLIAVSHPELEKAVKQYGGFSGFALVLRVGLTKNGNKTDISYTNPDYWAAAYFQKEYSAVAGNISKIEQAFENAFTGYGNFSQFGSEKGMTTKELQKYHYMLGMPYFQDNVKLGKFDSFNAAVKHIDKKLNNTPGVTKVYEKAIPSKKIKLYGVGLAGENGEASFMPTIDISNPKHTAFLPYELLVYDNQAYMLHGRFRIALSFPDLTMGTFMKIVSTPGEIEDMLKQLCK
jgi:hypothetical protein